MQIASTYGSIRSILYCNDKLANQYPRLYCSVRPILTCTTQEPLTDAAYHVHFTYCLYLSVRLDNFFQLWRFLVNFCFSWVTNLRLASSSINQVQVFAGYVCRFSHPKRHFPLSIKFSTSKFLLTICSLIVYIHFFLGFSFCLLFSLFLYHLFFLP